MASPAVTARGCWGARPRAQESSSGHTPDTRMPSRPRTSQPGASGSLFPGSSLSPRPSFSWSRGCSRRPLEVGEEDSHKHGARLPPSGGRVHLGTWVPLEEGSQASLPFARWTNGGPPDKVTCLRSPGRSAKGQNPRAGPPTGPHAPHPHPRPLRPWSPSSRPPSPSASAPRR